MDKQLHRRVRIQTGRSDNLFGFEWVPDQIEGLMVASVTVFGISLVYLGTAVP